MIGWPCFETEALLNPSPVSMSLKGWLNSTQFWALIVVHLTVKCVLSSRVTIINQCGILQLVQWNNLINTSVYMQKSYKIPEFRCAPVLSASFIDPLHSYHRIIKFYKFGPSGYIGGQPYIHCIGENSFFSCNNSPSVKTHTFILMSC